VSPGAIFVGVGCSLGCSPDELLDLVDAALGEAHVTDADVAAIATVDRRAREPGIVDAARRRGWPLATFPADALAATPVPTPSALVARHVGTPSVAEAAALLAAGARELLVAKRRSAHATCALARAISEEAPCRT
jgi:cobalt-precorrin 5A hydrolase/cobalt-precorrin 5A hydrolase/precorrin-3B C17-methyltransferase